MGRTVRTGSRLARSIRRYKHGKQSKSLDMLLSLLDYISIAWHSGRTSVFGRRTFSVQRETCSWRVSLRLCG